MRVLLLPDGRWRPLWRLAGFLLLATPALLAALVTAGMLARALGVTAAPDGHVLASPARLLLIAAPLAAALLAVNLAAPRLFERAPSAAGAGLTLERRTGRALGAGALWGAAAVSAALAGPALAGAFAFAPDERATLAHGAGFLIALLIAAWWEELAFRGYLLQSLARDWGFWPAAALLSAGFAALHAPNIADAAAAGGAAAAHAALFAANVLLAGLLLSRLAFADGTLWRATGFHWGWNVAQYLAWGVPLSGMAGAAAPWRATGRAGAELWTGGAYGPEGGLPALAVLAALLAVQHWRAPRARSPAPVGGAARRTLRFPP